MGLPTEILRFFYMNIDSKDQRIKPKLVKDFTHLPKNISTLNIQEFFKIINQFKNEGYLISAGHLPHISSDLFFNEALISLNFSEEVAKYGTYEFLINGFSSIANRFKNSVRPVIVTKQDGVLDIGTSFLLGNSNTLVTARHVIENTELIQIPDLKGNFIKVDEVTFPKNSNIDIALLLVTENCFFGLPAFNAKAGEILEEVMSIGYPPIPGFDAIQLYETASINNSFKFSKGKIIGNNISYLDNIEYLIINAKVKGGNSGSPIINRKGNVVGMVVQIPFDNQDSTRLDSLGYGIVNPESEIRKLLFGANNSPEIINIKTTWKGNGFTITE